MKAKTEAFSPKIQARRLIDRLAASASWDDVMQQIYVRQKFEAGSADLNAISMLVDVIRRPASNANSLWRERYYATRHNLL